MILGAYPFIVAAVSTVLPLQLVVNNAGVIPDERAASPLCSDVGSPKKERSPVEHIA